MTDTYPNRTRWKIARNEYARDYRAQAQQFIDGTPHLVPDWCLEDGVTVQDWVAWSVAERASSVSRVARRVFDAHIPKPAPEHTRPSQYPAPAPARVVAREPEPAPAPAPEPEPAPRVAGRWFVQCYHCALYVSARPGRPLTLSHDKKNGCSHP